MMNPPQASEATLSEPPPFTSPEDKLSPARMNQREMSFSDTSLLPGGWLMCVHPQGWVYFVNPSLKITTDSDIREEDTLRSIMALHSDSSLASKLEDDMEVQVNISSTNHDNAQSFNLVINHTLCVASFNIEDVTSESPSLQCPNEHNLISGAQSRVPFSKQECEELSKVLKELALPQSDFFRDAEHFGKYTAKQTQAFRSAIRQNTKPAVRQPGPILLVIITCFVNFFFFGIPWTYLVHISSATEYRGRLSSVQQSWDAYINRLIREYTHFLLISTVLLSATVSFLALEDLSQPARVGATLSTFASLGSIIVAVFSMWRHQIKNSTTHSFAYMHNARQSYLGHHGHAILLSLPPVLLIWAIVAFTASIIAYTLQGIIDQDVYTSTSTWILIAVFIIVLCCLCFALYTLTVIWRIGQGSKWKFWRGAAAGFRRAASV
ncbi:hypothetical protein ONZ45_g30 [Pleurotus djamor]|nr:hypothetical protein ONZ45_g30 [Pleurotus djamor]